MKLQKFFDEYGAKIDFEIKKYQQNQASGQN